MTGNNVLYGIIAIILGLFIIAFPMISILALDIITGLGLIFIGIWLFTLSYQSWSTSKALSIVNLLLGLVGIIVGIGIIGKIEAFSILVGLLIYVGGFFLIITGIVALVSGKGSYGRGGGMLGIILGVIYLIIGIYALNPLYLAFLIGFFLIISGIFQILTPAAEIE